ncbi:hypothetical protein KQX54_007980 [Cotesia glomerata]|uniref:Uncharacterized protein n=1 Tax=Cotesia glomerata TaxID=32391 RepID=A0AAV7IVJ4_COTGL|nr:hypothetical protein KQX54_007980 [Cotesia glomerata]
MIHLSTLGQRDQGKDSSLEINPLASVVDQRPVDQQLRFSFLVNSRTKCTYEKFMAVLNADSFFVLVVVENSIDSGNWFDSGLQIILYAYAIAFIGSKTQITAAIIAASTNWKLGNKILVQHVCWRYCVLPGVSSCGFNLVDCQLLVLSSNAISNHVLRPMPVKPFSDYSPCTLLLRLTLSLCLHY